MTPAELHPQVRAFLAGAVVEPWSRPLAETRALEDAAAAAIPPGPELDSVAAVTIPTRDGGVPGRCYEPAGARGTLVWMHGGGWVLGGLPSSDAMCRRLARAAGARIVSVEYRLAPEHPYPAGLDDATDALRWARDVHGSEPIAVGGDSAGANLAAVCAARDADARDGDGDGSPGGEARRAPLAAQLLVYPPTDAAMETPAWREDRCAAIGFSRVEMAGYWERYVPAGADREDPEISPLRRRALRGLAPAIVVLARLDPLCEEGLAYADALRAAGVEVDLSIDEQMIHGFFTRPGLFDAGSEAIERAGRALAARLQAAPVGRSPAR